MRPAAAVSAIAALLLATPAPADPMAPFLWSDRPVLIFAPDRYDARLVEQKGRFSMHRKEFRDRDITLIEIGGPFMRAKGEGVPHGPEIRARYGVPEDSFTIILVGKDGGEKLRLHEVTDPRVFYDLIDTMPMRRQEIEREGS